MRAGSGSPVVVDGLLWGMVIAASARENALPSGTGHRLAVFTEPGVQAQAELAASRARIVAAANEIRHGIERDLHDGAQQQLVSLALQLRAARAAVTPGLRRLQAELGQAAAGVAGVEAMAYYVVSEALANAAKHAAASAVHVGAAAAGDVIRLAVRDDGTGGADPARGSGLAGLTDRAAAIGGTLSVRSRPGEGTTLRAELPARPGQPSPAGRPGRRGPRPRPAGGIR
jgi:signal transduction histidine kinase